MILCFLLAILCIGYGILIRMAGSGTLFFAVWFGIAGLFIFSGIFIHWKLWQKLPVILVRIGSIVLALFLFFFFIIEGIIFSHFYDTGENNPEYIIVLGAQMREHGPSRVLRYRLDRAVEYLYEHPDAICVVSGGQGKNEPCSEAEGMAAYLEEQGIEKDRILLEPDSKTTSQNIQNSMNLIPQDAAIGIITNNFHLFRALQTAKKEGLTNISGIAADSSPLYLPNNMLREFLAEIKFLLP